MEVSRPYRAAFKSSCEKLSRVSDITGCEGTPQISYVLEVKVWITNGNKIYKLYWLGVKEQQKARY